MSKVDLKKITANAKKKTTRFKSSIYVDRDLWDRFVEKCKTEGVTSSKVLEEFMKEYAK